MEALQKMETKTSEQYKTWGKSRSNRLSNYDYSKDRPIHVPICTDDKENLRKIWQRSAFDHVIRIEENLKTVIEYIMNNPVRKGIVGKADDYSYSEWFDVEIQRYL